MARRTPIQASKQQCKTLVISSYYYSWLLEHNWRLNKHKWCSSLEAFVKAPSPSSHISIALVLTKKSAGQSPTPFREKAGLSWENIYMWPEKNSSKGHSTLFVFKRNLQCPSPLSEADLTSVVINITCTEESWNQ